MWDGGWRNMGNTDCRQSWRGVNFGWTPSELQFYTETWINMVLKLFSFTDGIRHYFSFCMLFLIKVGLKIWFLLWNYLSFQQFWFHHLTEQNVNNWQQLEQKLFDSINTKYCMIFTFWLSTGLERIRIQWSDMCGCQTVTIIESKVKLCIINVH